MQTLYSNQSEIRFGSLDSNGFDALLQSDRFLNSKKIIITDENVYDLWISHFISSFEGLKDAEIIQIPPGEENKVLEICHHIWGALSEYKIGRHDLIINLGGGVITDLGGFIAATYKRGLSFINVPTTLLSQVDASVGGKTGIDFGPYKNQIGVFADADYVFIDAQYLNTLPEKELLSGYAEMLKHGLITDKAYWNVIKKTDPTQAPEKLLETIHHSVTIKRDIVNADPQEENLRKTLNFGHTIGHAIEGYCLSTEAIIPHGFAVAWGMIAESYISKEMALLNTAEYEKIRAVIQEIYPPLTVNKMAIPHITNLLLNDKKNEGGKIKFTLLAGIGKSVYNQEVQKEIIEAAFLSILPD